MMITSCRLLLTNLLLSVLLTRYRGPRLKPARYRDEFGSLCRVSLDAGLQGGSCFEGFGSRRLLNCLDRVDDPHGLGPDGVGIVFFYLSRYLSRSSVPDDYCLVPETNGSGGFRVGCFVTSQMG
jgi:hypothetical protein